MVHAERLTVARPAQPLPAAVPTTDVLSEQLLLARLRNNDPSAFEALVRSESGHLLAVARRYLRKEEDAQDAVQQAFLSAFRALPEFNGSCRLTTWLHRIVTNAALMQLRAKTRHPEASIDDLLPAYLEDGAHAAPIRDWSAGAEEQLTRRQTRAQVRAAVEQLPATYRTVLLLRDIEERNTAETARVLGISPAAVKTRLHRARQALATLLAPVFPERAAGSRA